MDDDKPFVCSTPECGQRFTNEDHLAVHMRKHEMSLALNMGSLVSGTGRSPLGNMSGLFLDQTPTPTKFLKNCEEIGLFNELKNPFEEAFKKALDSTDGTTDNIPFPGPGSNDLNTPVPPIPKTVDDIVTDAGLKHIDENTRSDLIALVSSRLKKEKQSPQPTSTTSDNEAEDEEEEEVVSTSKGTENTKLPDQSPPTTDSKNVTMVTAAHSTTVSPPKTTIAMATPVVQQPQISMQVYLQLPSGQTVPVQIPATITNPGIQVMQAGVLPKVQQTITTTTQQQSQTVVLPSQSTVTQATTPTSQTSFAKQRLKAAIQSQAIPSPSSKSTPQIVQVSPEATSHLPGISGSLSSFPGAMSPLSIETASMASDTASSPDAADSTSSLKKARKSDDDSEDRRKKFLERNRAAAARCRQKRKQWINNLEKKGDELQSTNGRLQSEVNLLRAEVAHLKTLLLAHKDCPITLQQKSQGQFPLAFSMLDSTVSAAQGGDSNLQATDISNSGTIDLTEVISTTTWVTGATVINTVAPTTTIAAPTTGHKTITIIPKVIKTEPTHNSSKK